jgi:hypothetical protein
MHLKSHNHKDIFVITDKFDNTNERSAIITFTNGKFENCSYTLSCNKNYTFEDWVFLYEVAKYIMDEQESFNAGDKSGDK